MKREDGSCPLKTGGSLSNRESWSIFESFETVDYLPEFTTTRACCTLCVSKKIVNRTFIAISSAMSHSLSPERKKLFPFTVLEIINRYTSWIFYNTFWLVFSMIVVTRLFGIIVNNTISCFLIKNKISSYFQTSY